MTQSEFKIKYHNGGLVCVLFPGGTLGERTIGRIGRLRSQKETNIYALVSFPLRLTLNIAGLFPPGENNTVSGETRTPKEWSRV